MDYRVIEEHGRYVRLREPDAEELESIVSQPDNDKFVWVRIDGVLLCDVGHPGFIRLLSAVGLHQDSEFMELLEELVSIELGATVLDIRGTLQGTEITMGGPLSDGTIFYDAYSIAKFLSEKSDNTSGINLG